VILAPVGRTEPAAWEDGCTSNDQNGRTDAHVSELAAARGRLETAEGPIDLFRLDALDVDPARLPKTVLILLENLLRRAGSRDVSDDDVRALAAWPGPARDVAYMPGRVLMQDFTGVPAVVDLAAMRSAAQRAGVDPMAIEPSIPVDLVIDHSVQVDLFRTPEAYERNIEFEYRRNGERYSLLRWAQQAFEGLRVVPPGAGICHQVNLEHLGQVVSTRDGVAFPDTLVGTDSHTTMINGLGVLGWGVGGIEAEAAMLGQPTFLPQPIVIGVRTIGALPPGTTATDLVLTLTEMLRAHGVVGKFVEFFGDGLSSLSTADRATLSNMCPEYGATSSYFPVDAETLRYLAFTGREDRVDLAERYAKEQGLFRRDGDPEPTFSEILDLDLSAVVPSMAGPKRPQDRVPLPDVWDSFVSAFRDHGEPDPKGTEIGRFVAEGGSPRIEELPGADQMVNAPASDTSLGHGSVVIAAITSCTNTSNPSVMLAAGLLARKAAEAGLSDRPAHQRVRVENWRDVRTGLARPLDADERLYVCRMDSYDEVLEQLFGVGCLQGMTPRTQVVVPGDGANGLREAVLLAFPKAQYILDHPHLKSQLYDTATALELEGAARHAWVSEHLDRFWAGEVDQVLETWQARQEDEPNERLRQLIEHVSRFEDCVDYGAYHERGWPLGSGEVESAHRYVPQERLKIAGACWNPDNVNPMLALRVIRTNHWWDDFWQWRLEQKQAQVGV